MGRIKKCEKVIEQIGFKEEASASVKEAFIRHIIKSSFHMASVENRKRYNEKGRNHRLKLQSPNCEKVSQPLQLCFEFYQDQSHKKEKVS